MAAMGLGITLDDIRAPFRNRLALVIIVIANNVIIPLLGLVIVAMPQPLLEMVAPALAEQLVTLIGAIQIGFMLLLIASGSLLAPYFADFVGAPVEFAKGIVVVLVGISTILVPIELGALSEVVAKLAKPPDPIFMTLLLYQLLPLALGILVKARYALFAEKLRSLFTQLTTLVFLIMGAALLLSGQRLITGPDALPPVRTDLFISTNLAAVEELDSGQIPAILAETFKAQGVTLPDQAALLVMAPGEKWAIVNGETTYLADLLTDIVTPTLAITKTDAVTYTFTITTSESGIKELDGRVISTTIESAFGARNLILTADLILVRQEGAKWALVDDVQTYQIDFKDDLFSVFQESSQPVGLLEGFLAALGALPDIGPAIDFLLQLLKIGLPYLFFIAVAVVLMAIGYYSGTVVQSLVSTPKDEAKAKSTETEENKGKAANNAKPPLKIPETLAFTATLRNISLALIVATEHIVQWRPATGEPADLATVMTILAFFVVCLLVAAHKATQWKTEADTTASTAKSVAPSV
jgi:predicted Na+-dependent transporter